MTIVPSSDWESDLGGIVTKRCQTCHQDKPRDQFYRNRRYADGLMQACKDCQSVKACTICHLVKPLDEFYTRRAAADGHLGRCKTCMQQQQKAFRAAHPEYVRQQYEAKRRARKRRAGKIEPIDRDYVYKRDQGICSLCGRKVRKQDMSIDHIVPLSLGGAHCLTNVTLVHLQCNTRKRTRALPQQMYLIG